MAQRNNSAFYLFVFFVLNCFNNVYTQAPNILNFRQISMGYASASTGWNCEYTFQVTLDINYFDYIMTIPVLDFHNANPTVVNGSTLLNIGTSTSLGTYHIVGEFSKDSNTYPVTFGDDFQCIEPPPTLAYEEFPSDFNLEPQLTASRFTYFFRAKNYERRANNGAGCSLDTNLFVCHLIQPDYVSDPTLFTLVIYPLISQNIASPSTVSLTLTEPVSHSMTFTNLLEPYGSLASNVLVPPPAMVYKKDSDPNTYVLFSVQGDSTNLFLGVDQSGSGYMSYAPVKGDSQSQTYLIRYRNNPTTSSQSCNIVFYNGAAGTQHLTSIINGVPSLTIFQTYISSVQQLDPNGHTHIIQVIYIKSTYLDELFSYSLDNYFFEPSITFPLGYESGDLKEYYFSMSQMTSPFSQSQLTSISGTNSEFVTTNIGSYGVSPLAIDTLPPVINDVQTFRLNSSFVLLRINITDDVSGFSMLQFGGGLDYLVIDVLPHHLVKGDLNNGVYEIITDTLFKTPSTVAVADRASNRVMFTYDGVYNVNGKKLDLLQDILSPDTITLFYFEKPIVDVSQQGHNNTLYLNYIGAGPHSKVMFFPLFNTPDHTDVQQDPSNHYHWDPVLNLIKIDFYIPSGLVAGKLKYVISSKTGFNDEMVVQILGSNSTLTILSDSNANQLPPLVIGITAQPNSPIAITDPTNIGWVIKVETPRHRLKSALFTVTSDYDPVGFNFTFNPNNNLHINDLVINFQVLGSSRSQIYTISYAYLEDDEGLKSGFNALPWTNAFFQVEIPSITVACPILTSNPPILLSFKQISTNPINLIGANRKVVYEYEASSSRGLLARIKPVVYLTGSLNTKALLTYIRQSNFQCQTEIVSSNSTNTKYQSLCDIPFGYGYPEGLLVSVYGFVNGYMEIGGYSANSLRLKGFDYFINGSTSSFPSLPPVIDSSNNYTGSGTLELRGYRFGSSSQNLAMEIRTQGQLYTVYNPTYHHFNGFSLSFDYQSIEPFLIRFKNDNDPNYSNEYLVDPWGIGWDSSSSSATSSSSHQSSSSEIDQSSSTNITPTKEPPKCPGTPKCGGDDKGVCLSSGGCQCKYPYYGEQCTSVIVVIPTPKPNPNNPSTNITIDIPGTQDHVQLSTLVSVVSLKEIDNNNVDVKTFTFDQWIYTSITNDIHLYETSIINNDIKTNISVRIEFFNDTKIIYFAGQNLTMNPSTLKYQITMSPYSFQSSNNHLQFIMSAQLTASDNPDKCTFNEFSEGIENSDYLRLQIDDHSLYGRFIKRALIDDRPTTVSNVLLDSEFKQYDKSNTKSTQSFIGISMPFFRKSVLIDPDFSILLDTDKASTKEGSICESKPNSLSAAKIAGIVIGSVAFAAIIVVSVVYYVYKKKEYGSMKKGLEQKLQSIS